MAAGLPDNASGVRVNPKSNPNPDSPQGKSQANDFATSQFATFYVDGQFFGVDVLHVQEVLRFQDMTRVPLAPATIQGLINLRGQIVTAIDMRRRLGLRPRSDSEVPMNVVLRSEDGAVSLLVDEIGDVLDVTAESREPVPENIASPQAKLLAGVAKLEQKLLLILETQHLLNAESRDA
jgi:purine-binding chemotaxis protein CheW